MFRVVVRLIFCLFLCQAAFCQLTDSSVGEIKLRAEAGDAIAQDKLAERYLTSFYFADAVKMFRAAAEKGVVNSQWRLSQILLEGSSGFPQRSTAVPADPKQAIRWLKKAAAAGHTAAQRDLGRCFESGKSVTKDSAEAYKWFGIAAKTDTILARSFREQMALKMKPAEIQEGERRITAFVVGALLSVWEEIQLKGISGPAQRRLTIINTTTVESGEKFFLNLSGEKISVTCEKGRRGLRNSLRG